MKHIQTPVRYCDEDWMLFDADDQWLASLDAGETGPEMAKALNEIDELRAIARLLVEAHNEDYDGFDEKTRAAVDRAVALEAKEKEAA